MTDQMNGGAGEPSVGGSLFTATLGMSLALGTSFAWAQDAKPAAADKGPSGESAVTLNKVTVRGKKDEPVSPKFTAPLVDTPMSVTIIPQTVMQETAASSLQDALRNIPGITFAAGEGGTPTGDLPSIRGFNSAGSIYVDGMRDIGLQTRDIFDLEQVEVIKGPDSSIAGRSAGGGSINLVSKTAQADNFTEATGSWGSAGQYRATLDTNLRLNDDIAARLNLMDMGGGVPGRDSAVRTRKKGLAGTVTFGLQKPTRLILNYYHFEDRSTPDYGVPVDYVDTGRPLTQTQGLDPRNFYGLADRDFRRNPVDSGNLRLEHDFAGGWSLRSQLRYTVSRNDYLVTLPYQATDSDFNIEPGLVYRLPIGNRDRTRGLISQTEVFGHFDTGPVRHDVDIGFEASQEKERLYGGGSWLGYNVVSSAGPQGFAGGDCSDPALLASFDCTNILHPNPRDPWRGSVTTNSSEIAYFTTRDYAPYVFDTMTLSPHWKLNAGLRWDHYNTRADDAANPTNFGGTDRQSFLSYQLGLMYKPVAPGTLYLMTSSAAIPAAQSFSGSGQDQAYPTVPGAYPGNIGLKPEKTKTIELGTKWKLFDNRLLLSADVFRERHINVGIETAPDVYSQLGETISKGAELSVNGSITDDWNVIAGYSYVDARITNGSYYDEIGQQVPNSPRNTFSLWSTYRAMPALVLGAGAYYRDKQVGYAGPPDEFIDAYWRFDAMAKWRINSHVALQLNVQNLFDKLYYAKSFYWYALPAPGRTITAMLDVKF